MDPRPPSPFDKLRVRVSIFRNLNLILSLSKDDRSQVLRAFFGSLLERPMVVDCMSIPSAHRVA